MARRARRSSQAATSAQRSGAAVKPQWSAAPGPEPSTVRQGTASGARGWSRRQVRSSGTTAETRPPGSRQTVISPAPCFAPSVSHQASVHSGVVNHEPPGSAAANSRQPSRTSAGSAALRYRTGAAARVTVPASAAVASTGTPSAVVRLRRAVGAGPDGARRELCRTCPGWWWSSPEDGWSAAAGAAAAGRAGGRTESRPGSRAGAARCRRAGRSCRSGRRRRWAPRRRASRSGSCGRVISSRTASSSQWSRQGWTAVWLPMAMPDRRSVSRSCGPSCS